MNSIEYRLASIGFAPARSTAERWRVERTGSVRRRARSSRSEPACSPVLSVWLERLRDRRRPAIYRIRRVAEPD